MADQFSDYGVTTVAGGSGGVGTPLNATDTTLHVPTGVGAKFPATGPFMLQIGTTELAQCSVRSADILTIARGQEGTAAATWPLGTTVQQALTAGNMNNLWSATTTNTTNIATNTTNIATNTANIATNTTNIATNTTNTNANTTAISNATAGTYNVRAYGALGNNSNDDSTAIQAALDAARAAGGGVVYLPAGTYRVTAHTHPVSAGSACLWAGTNTVVRGDGPSATIIKLANSQPNQTWILTNYQTSAPYTDTNISVVDLTVDGNSANQNVAVVDADDGIKIHGVNGVTLRNVEVRHVFGTTSGANGPNGTPGEGFHFDTNACTHVTHDQCRAWSDSTVPTATGFSANRGNDISYTNCWAYGMKSGQGFTHWTSWSVRYANCWSAATGADCFHSEFTDGPVYVNCQAGGTTNANTTNPYAASTNLGGSVGIHLFNATNAHVVNCIGQRNTNYGIMVEAATGPVEIIGGSFNNNNYGIRIQDAASVTNTTIKSRPDCAGNTTGAVWFSSGTPTVYGFTTFPTAPTVPATTVALTNPFPSDMMVYLVGGTVTVIAVDGTTIGTGTSATVPLTIRLRQQGAITLTYTVAPTWKWQAA